MDKEKEDRLLAHFRKAMEESTKIQHESLVNTPFRKFVFWIIKTFYCK